MFLEASVAHMVTGDVEAMIASAERARALSAGAEPAVELLATAVIGEGQIALGDLRRRGAAPGVRAVPDGGRPLAMVEIVGMAAHASIWIEDWDAASRVLSRVLGAARAASAVSALIHPLAVQAHLDLRRGRWAAALAGASESAELAEDTGQLAAAAAGAGGADAGRGRAGARGRLPPPRGARAVAGRRRLPARGARPARAWPRPDP